MEAISRAAVPRLVGRVVAVAAVACRWGRGRVVMATARELVPGGAGCGAAVGVVAVVWVAFVVLGSAGSAQAAMQSYRDAVLADAPKGFWRLGEVADPFVDSSLPGGHAGSKRTWSSAQGAGSLFFRAQPGALAGSGDDGAILGDAAPSGFGYPNVEGAFVRAQWGSDGSINFANRAPFSIEAWVKPKPKACVPSACPWNGGVLGN